MLTSKFFWYLGCDRKKYHDRRDKLEETHRQRVEGLVKQWEQAEKRFKLLKVTDENQATASIAGEYFSRKKTVYRTPKSIWK